MVGAMTPQEKAAQTLAKEQGRMDIAARAAKDFQEASVAFGLAPTTPTPQDEHWLSRTAGRTGSLAAQETVQLLDALTLDQFDYLDTASDYWKQKALENEKDTGNIRDAWAEGGGEFGTIS